MGKTCCRSEDRSASTKALVVSALNGHTRRARYICARRWRYLFAPCCALCVLFADGAAWGQSDPAATTRPDVTVVPPRASQTVEATYPTEAVSEGRALLIVTVERDGTVSRAEIHQSAGEDVLDSAAIAAVKRWRFEPAKRGGKPIRSKVRVAIEVVPPLLEATEPKAAPRRDDSRRIPPRTEVGVHKKLAVEVEEAGPDREEPAMQVTVTGERASRTSNRGASNFVMGKEILEAAPTREGADVVKRAPGMYIARAGGMAVAHRYMLRGFDAEHGQDIAFSVGGLPINLPSHIHGQGYADLGLLIGETVHRLRVMEGVYDPRQGDFAVAGSMDIDLGVERRGWLLKTSYGRFNTLRQLAMWAPRGQPTETFGAASYESTDGFGTGRQGSSGSAVFQTRFGSPGAWSYRAIGLVHAARANLAGVVRTDDVETGRVDFDGVYPYPTAQRQNALAMRTMVGFFADHRSDSGAHGEVGAWLGYDNFRLQHNFTGFVQQSRTLENVAGRGDLIEQQNRTLSMGISSRYRTHKYKPASWTGGALELGLDGRVDVIDQAQNLIDATVRSQTWDQRVDASVRGGDLGLWGDLDWNFPYVRVRVGLRGAALFYDVDDRLGNFAPLTRPDDTYIEGFRRSAFGLTVGPRTSIQLLPLNWLSIRAAYGEGYRSPQARTLDDGEKAPFTKVRSGDAGVRLRWDERLEITFAGFLTHLSDDVAFEAREGRLERIGATRRAGGVLHMVTRPWPWLIGSTSLTVVDAVLLEPPPPTAEEPQPAFVEGQNLPFVPQLVGRTDIGARGPLVRRLAGHDLHGRVGAGLNYLGPRPLPFGGAASPVALLDVGAGIAWGPVELGLDVFNVLDVEHASSVFNFPSNWDPDATRSRLPEQHTAAGAPMRWMTSLQVQL